MMEDKTNCVCNTPSWGKNVYIRECENEMEMSQIVQEDTANWDIFGCTRDQYVSDSLQREESSHLTSPYGKEQSEEGNYITIGVCANAPYGMKYSVPFQGFQMPNTATARMAVQISSLQEKDTSRRLVVSSVDMFVEIQ